jgi:site-specific DNA-adenine methylase
MKIYVIIINLHTNIIKFLIHMYIVKNHFSASYHGNKRDEVETIYSNLHFDNIETTVEPFCGSCDLSYYIWTQNKETNFKYVYNDLNYNLVEFYD